MDVTSVIQIITSGFKENKKEKNNMKFDVKTSFIEELKTRPEIEASFSLFEFVSCFSKEKQLIKTHYLRFSIGTVINRPRRKFQTHYVLAVYIWNTDIFF